MGDPPPYNLLGVTVFTPVGYDIFGRVWITVIGGVALLRREIPPPARASIARFHESPVETVVAHCGNAVHSATVGLVSWPVKCSHCPLVLEKRLLSSCPCFLIFAFQLDGVGVQPHTVDESRILPAISDVSRAPKAKVKFVLNVEYRATLRVTRNCSERK